MTEPNDLIITAKSFDAAKTAVFALSIIFGGNAICITAVIMLKLPAFTAVLSYVIFGIGPVVFIKKIRQRFSIDLTAKFTGMQIEIGKVYANTHLNSTKLIPLTTLKSYSVYRTPAKNMNSVTFKTNDGRVTRLIYYSDQDETNGYLLKIVQWFSDYNRNTDHPIPVAKAFLATKAGLAFILILLGVYLLIALACFQKTDPKASIVIMMVAFLTAVFLSIARKTALDDLHKADH